VDALESPKTHVHFFEKMNPGKMHAAGAAKMDVLDAVKKSRG
jgi:hypothetical protein